MGGDDAVKQRISQDHCETTNDGLLERHGLGMEDWGLGMGLWEERKNALYVSLYCLLCVGIGTSLSLRHKEIRSSASACSVDGGRGSSKDEDRSVSVTNNTHIFTLMQKSWP